jgi:putative transport protein
MLGVVGAFLEAHPDLAVYLVIGLGYAIGKLQIAGFGLGPVTGALFAGILVGQLGHVPVSDTAKSVLFLLFLFGIGYSVGPKFLSALKGDALPGVVIGLLVPIVGVATAVAVARFLGLDVGFAAGLFSGALTESPAIGTAAEAIHALPLDAATQERLVSHIAVADALCYMFGTVGVILFSSVIGPKLLGIDVRAEAAKLDAKYGLARGEDPFTPLAWRPFEIRAYRIPEGGRAIGMSAAQLERALEPSRAFALRLRRDGRLLEVRPDLILRAGDVVAVAARRELLVELLGKTGGEVEDHELLEIPSGSFEIFVTAPALIGRPLVEVARQDDLVRGVFLRRIRRGDLDIPIAPSTALERGDVITVLGPEPTVERVARSIGPIVRPSDATDFVTLGLAIFLGGAIGVLLTIPVGGMRIALSTSVGTLLAGLFVGWLRSRRPLFANIPDGAVSLMTSLGLAAFVGMIGLKAGPIFIDAVKAVGLPLLLGGVVVTSVPLLTALLVGKYVLRMNPILLLGALAGAQTMTAALAALQDRCGSPIAVLGYTAAVPFGHILLTTGGTVVVWVMSSLGS